MVDIIESSKSLKMLVSRYDPKYFFGDVASLIPMISSNRASKTLSGLSSPLRQLQYLLSLNLTSDPNDYEIGRKFTDEEFDKIKELLIEIELGYAEMFFPKEGEHVDDMWKEKRRVAMPTFLSYFNQGPLNYDEQIIERVERYFAPFDNEIVQSLGLSVRNFIDIYNYIDGLVNKFFVEKLGKKEGEQTWEEFAATMADIPPDEWQAHLPEHYVELFGYMQDMGKPYRFTRGELIAQFGQDITDAFLRELTIVPEPTDYIYYTEPSPVQLKPILKVDNETFQTIGANTLIIGVYNLLFNYCTGNQDIEEKFYKARGKQLEKKITEIFLDFFNNDVFIHESYFTQDKHEQDILIVAKGNALIIEAKASKRDEPLRDPERAYERIQQNFNSVIQKAYDQSYRVKSKFIAKEPLDIYRDELLRNKVVTIRTKNYHNAFSILVTLERFGQIQTDLSELLEIYDNDEYPLSICIDDLETILLSMKKQKLKPSLLFDYLLKRQKFHSKVVCGDETEIFGALMTGQVTDAMLAEDKTIITKPSFANIFDEIYQTKGLGFKNEKEMDLKTSGKYIPLGSAKVSSSQ